MDNIRKFVYIPKEVEAVFGKQPYSTCPRNLGEWRNTKRLRSCLFPALAYIMDSPVKITWFRHVAFET